MNSATIVQKLWNYCNVLRDDGMSYGDYVEQLTYLLFLKMADERSKPPFNLSGESPSPILKGYDWPSLLDKDGDELFDHYRHTLEKLGAEKGTIGLIFAKALNKFQDPAKLRRLVVDLIDCENWSAMGADVKGDAYEGLLEKNAQDTKSGAGQYFTPRPLIQAMVDCIAPKAGETVCDPACGTGGFLFAAHNHVAEHYPNLTREQKKHLKEKAFVGYELVQSTARLAAMNMMLHGIGSDKSVPIVVADALAADPGERFDVVLANPPFGKKSSTMITGAEGKVTTEKDVIERDDFWATTSNKQLNFVQHIKTLLKQHGRAAVVLPDNVLFEGGAGETIRRRLLAQYDLHTILRLPTGIFYAGGVKANVLFFDRAPPSERVATEGLWVYDLRTNQRFTLRERPLKTANLTDFIKCYRGKLKRHERTETERFHRFAFDDLDKRDKLNLDLFWLKDASATDPDSLPQPDEIAAEIVVHLELALDRFRSVAAKLGVSSIA